MGKKKGKIPEKILEKIHVKNSYGETFTMEVHEHDTITSIKNMIFEKHNIPYDQQNILFSDSRPSDLSDIPKLEDAKLAGTKQHSKECTLILTEGDSAKSLVMMGLTVVKDRDRYGVFPLIGKPPNVSRGSRGSPKMKKMLENNVINNLSRILGLVHNQDNVDEKKIYDSLRYGQVLLMMDQDEDGSHIKGLVINLIHKMWPSLVTKHKFLSEFTTPIVKVTHSNPHAVKSFYTLQAFRDWRQDKINDLSGCTIKYYKGLGSSTDDEAIEYFKKMDQNKKIFIWEDDSDSKAIEVAFDKEKVQDRRAWIKRLKTSQANNCLDQDVKYIRFRDFIDKEYILYANAILKRSIPSITDGLVPVQRKILYCSFKKNLVNEIKVNQFIGYVSEKCAYHHNEEGLAETIIRMAQNFVGKNNINLLKPIGQYGTRTLNGKDHASHRYLNTELSSLTSYLFCNVDDEILDYELAEDGKTIEPKWLLPVIPMILVNGSQGVGIGWSSFVPKYNPQDIINNIRCKLKGESLKDMTPWYKGFNGTVVATKNTWYHTDGSVSSGKKKDIYHITELPIGKRVEEYKKFLQSRSEGTAKKEKNLIIKKFEQIGDGRTVGFHIEFMPGKAPTEHDDLITTLQLRTKISTDNMHLYNNIGDIEKFYSATHILEEFYETRLGYYKMRHTEMLTKICSDLADLTSTRNFVELARKQKFDFVMKDSKDLQEFFMVHNVADVSIESLLSLPLSNFLNEGLKKLEDKITEKEKEKNALSVKKETQLWEDDLNAFEVAWKKEEASWKKSDTMSCPICDGVACRWSTTPTVMEPRRSHRLKKPNPKYPFFHSMI